MKIALTGGESPLGRALAAALGGEHTVAAAAGDLRDPAAAARAVAGADALVHLAPRWPQAPAAAAEAAAAAAGGGGDALAWLDEATRGTYVLLGAAAAAGVRRVVLGSTLALLERYPAAWAVDEAWRPRPAVGPAGAGGVPGPAQLAAYLAEQSAQATARVAPLQVVALRLGALPPAGAAPAAGAAAAPDARALHPADAVQAVRLALTRPLRGRGWAAAGGVGDDASGWWLYHIPGGGRFTRFPLAAAGDAETGLGYAPAHAAGAGPDGDGDGALPDAAGDLSVLAPPEPVPSRPIRSVVVFGAGGPLAAAAAAVLAPAYRLRLADVRPLAEIAAEGKPQSPGAPLPRVLGAPHEAVVTDVTDPAAVRAACAGMDAVVNCTVVRPDPVQAFRVNCLGAVNVARAAAAHGIRRVVHTGPQLVTNDRPAGYWWDFAVPDDAPSRPGTSLYGHSKFLGEEAMRVFAEYYDLEVPALLFSIFADPETAQRRGGGVFPMTVSWEDAGHAVRRALEVAALPSPFETFHILADLPHGKYSNAKARRLLGWQPRDTLARLWAARAPAGPAGR